MVTLLPVVPADSFIVSVDRVGDLASALRAANVTVPGRASGRTHYLVEIYSLIRVLASRPYRLSDFPLKLVKRERPDFLLSANGVAIGVEHTEAVPQNAAKEDFLRDFGVGSETHFVRPAAVGERAKGAKEIRAEIEADEMGEGWMGDSVEFSWVEAMTQFVSAKIQSAKSPDYTRFERTWLVVYDNWPAPILNHIKAVPLLTAELIKLATWSTFERVFILNESVLLEIEQTAVHVHCVNHC
ncbi:hypothetical protein [Xanthomonas translucens]|uniref:hypothetical protein n=1 Tax=Xanthomonas campestris pv. translucens TaxID=343 RepID=UPI0007335A61|nr:hypothetical protein [Xanthomonas translucens]KTF40446.1 hypothetical protein OZ12_07015 [Xanthomonas translucens pv. translucens]